jgi:uncharacterized oligopeptide transporter (OPT) family protein
MGRTSSIFTRGSTEERIERDHPEGCTSRRPTADNPRGTPLPWPVLAGFTLFIALLGVTLAIPMKRNLINQEKLRFPSGTAAAVTLQGLYSHGASAVVQARALLPAALKIMDFRPGIRGAGKTYAPSDWGIKRDDGPALIASGALIDLRATLSMVAGSLFVVLVLGPLGMESTWVNPAGAVVAAAARPDSASKEIGTWLGAPVLVSASLLSFAMPWRTIARALQGFRCAAEAEAPATSERIDVPLSWFLIGGSVAGAGLVTIARLRFEIPVAFGILAVVRTFVLALVACRAVGETDVTPSGSMGKIMQLTYDLRGEQRP